MTVLDQFNTIFKIQLMKLPTTHIHIENMKESDHNDIMMR